MTLLQHDHGFSELRVRVYTSHVTLHAAEVKSTGRNIREAQEQLKISLWLMEWAVKHTFATQARVPYVYTLIGG